MNHLTVAGGVPLTMSSREIAELTGKEPSHVNRDIRAMLDALADDPELDHVREEKDARGYTAAFHLGRELTYTLLAGYSIALRRRVVARWQELEAQQPKPPAELSRMDILNLAMESEQARIEAEQKLALAAPKVEFVDQFVRANGSKGFRAVCKLLNAKEPDFRLFLVEKKIMYRLGDEWMPYQQHIDAGRFEIKAGVAHVSEHAYNRALFTPKGVNWVAAEWAKHRVALVVAGKAVAL